jgi:hypothetical protein
MATCNCVPVAGYTALHLAVTAGHAAVVETLLLSGADFEARINGVSCSSLYNRFEFLQRIPIVPMS